MRGQLRDLRPAIAFEVKGRRPPGRMVAAMVLGLDDQRAALAAISAPRLAPAIPPPTMMTSKSLISRRGYELESRAV